MFMGLMDTLHLIPTPPRRSIEVNASAMRRTVIERNSTPITQHTDDLQDIAADSDDKSYAGVSDIVREEINNQQGTDAQTEEANRARCCSLQCSGQIRE